MKTTGEAKMKANKKKIKRKQSTSDLRDNFRQCNIHVTYMQHTCNTHVTHM